MKGILFFHPTCTFDSLHRMY